MPFYQIRALIRPWRLTGVLEALEAHGIRGLTTYDAQGAGVQSGSVERYQGATFDDTTHALVAKTVLEVVLAREQAQDVVDIIINAAQTGEIGDGKIFLTPVADVVRIRTGETGEDAERMAGDGALWFKSDEEKKSAETKRARRDSNRRRRVLKASCEILKRRSRARPRRERLAIVCDRYSETHVARPSPVWYRRPGFLRAVIIHKKKKNRNKKKRRVAVDSRLTAPPRARPTP